jgi:hypothetical protein
MFSGRGIQWRYWKGSILKQKVRNSRWRRQTGCTYISASRQDSEKIIIAICMFLGSGNSKLLSERLHIGTGSQKFKKAPAITGSTCSSAFIQDSKEIPEANPVFSGSMYSMAILRKLNLKSGSEKFKMAAAKLEILVSQFLGKIGKKFQRLFACFWVEKLSGTIGYAPSWNRK